MLMKNDFEIMYDDWMDKENWTMKKTFVAMDLAKLLSIKYPANISKEIDDKYDQLYDKALVIHQKMLMAIYAAEKFLTTRREFEGGQNMDIPTLYGYSNTKMLFYFEGLIINARSALDAAATIYTDLIFDMRNDSFNKFSKMVLRDNSLYLDKLKKYFETEGERANSVYRLLCGNRDNMRALRDIIIHQSNVKLQYCEYKDTSEKEHLFLVIKDYPAIDIDFFMKTFLEELEDLFLIANESCENSLNNRK